MLAVTDRIGLEPDRARELLGEGGVEVSLGLDELGPLDGPRGFRVTEVGEELHAVRLDEQRGIRAREARQVDDVRRRRDEQRLLQRLAQAFYALVHEPFSAR